MEGWQKKLTSAKQLAAAVKKKILATRYPKALEIEGNRFWEAWKTERDQVDIFNGTQCDGAETFWSSRYGQQLTDLLEAAVNEVPNIRTFSFGTASRRDKSGCQQTFGSALHFSYG